MTAEKILDVSQILLDYENPRLAQIQESQREAIRLMATTQADKIIVLAEHIVNHGTNPASRPIVIESETDPDFYYVLDGNRRITAPETS